MIDQQPASGFPFCKLMTCAGNRRLTDFCSYQFAAGRAWTVFFRDSLISSELSIFSFHYATTEQKSASTSATFSCWFEWNLHSKYFWIILPQKLMSFPVKAVIKLEKFALWNRLHRHQTEFNIFHLERPSLHTTKSHDISNGKFAGKLDDLKPGCDFY